MGTLRTFDIRLLHALFDELVNHVKVELAWHNMFCDGEERKKHKKAWYLKHIFPIGTSRNAEAGLAYLKWAAELKNDVDWTDVNDPSFGLPTSQAMAAQEIMMLYIMPKKEKMMKLKG